jgi:hypothetical protein
VSDKYDPDDRVTIVSDGTGLGTRVRFKDIEIPATRIEIFIDPLSVVRAVIYVDNVALEMEDAIANLVIRSHEDGFELTDDDKIAQLKDRMEEVAEEIVSKRVTKIKEATRRKMSMTKPIIRSSG